MAVNAEIFRVSAKFKVGARYVVTVESPKSYLIFAGDPKELEALIRKLKEQL